VPVTQRVQVALAVTGALLLGIGLLCPPSMYVVAPALALLLGGAEPLRTTRLQRMAPDDARARIASAASACDMAVSTMALPLAGFWRQRRT
jgi:hypothetical protein